MKLGIYGRTNHGYCMVNTAIFHLKNGGTITIDREETEHRVIGGDLSMLWKGLYIWAFNGVLIGSGDGRIYPHTSLIKLLEGATLELSLEDDAPDADYEVTNIEWCIFEGENEVFGSGYNVKIFKHLINSLEYTDEMFHFDPATGETKGDHQLNDLDMITVKACRDAIAYIKEKENL